MDWWQPKHLLDPGTLPGALALLVVVAGAAWLLSWSLERVIRRSTWMMDRFGRHTDETVIRYALRIKTVLVYLAAGAFFASLVPALQSLLGTVVASAGITAVVVGFAAKSTLANLVSGLTLAVYRPFRIGDRITLENETGIVEDITLRHTIVRTWENKRLVIPNEKIDSMSLINYSIVDPKVLLSLDVGIAYDADLDLARGIMLEEAKACPHVMEADQAPAGPVVRLVELADSAVVLRLLVWAPSMDSYWQARYHLLEAIKKSFDRQGVEIPFPHRTVVLKNPPPAPPA